MRGDEVEDVLLPPKSIDNSKVVREVDPRSNRDLWLLLLLIGVFVGAVVLYAWPHFEIRQTGIASQQMHRERERLVEENRKLRLERAALQNLRRVESIALRVLGMAPPAPDQLIVVEKAQAAPDGARLASAKTVGVRDAPVNPTASDPEAPPTEKLGARVPPGRPEGHH